LNDFTAAIEHILFVGGELKPKRNKGQQMLAIFTVTWIVTCDGRRMVTISLTMPNALSHGTVGHRWWRMVQLANFGGACMVTWIAHGIATHADFFV
jgi:hypothetical protein